MSHGGNRMLKVSRMLKTDTLTFWESQTETQNLSIQWVMYNAMSQQLEFSTSSMNGPYGWHKVQMYIIVYRL